MRKIQIIWIIVFLLAVAVVMAAPPFIQAETSSVTGLGIAYPQTPYLSAGVDSIDFHFHVFNSSGYPLTAPYTNCTLHVYNKTHKHVLDISPVAMDSNGVDYKATFGTNITNYPQTYSYVIQCKNIYEAGWIESTFTVAYTDADSSYYSQILWGLIALTALILYISFKLNDEHAPIRLFLVWLSFGLFILIAAIMQQAAIESFMSPSVISLIDTIYTVIMILAIVISAYFMIYYLSTLLQYIKEQAANKNWWNKKDAKDKS